MEIIKFTPIAYLNNGIEIPLYGSKEEPFVLANDLQRALGYQGRNYDWLSYAGDDVFDLDVNDIPNMHGTRICLTKDGINKVLTVCSRVEAKELKIIFDSVLKELNGENDELEQRTAYNEGYCDALKVLEEHCRTLRNMYKEDNR